MRIARGHEKWFVDFQTPGAALNGFIRLETGEEAIEIAQSVRHRIASNIKGSVPVHREFHLGFVIWDWLVDLLELHTELGVNIPAKRRAEETGTEVVHAIVGIAQHDSKVFRYILEQDVQRMHILNDGLVAQDAVVEDVAFRL